MKDNLNTASLGDEEACETPISLGRGERESVKVFISHSHLDAAFVELICDFLETSELVGGEIRCTSVAGHGLLMGQKIPETIRAEIAGSKIVIGVFTKEALASQNVMLEVGAGWGFDKVLIPILGPEVKQSDLPSWLQQGHWMEWTSTDCWKQFEEILLCYLGKRINDKARFTELIEKLVAWRPDKT